MAEGFVEFRILKNLVDGERGGNGLHGLEAEVAKSKPSLVKRFLVDRFYSVILGKSIHTKIVCNAFGDMREVTTNFDVNGCVELSTLATCIQTF